MGEPGAQPPVYRLTAYPIKRSLARLDERAHLAPVPSFTIDRLPAIH